jgi:hypothetical protein
MKFCKIILQLLTVGIANVHAETIEFIAATGIPGAANTATRICVKIPFIKRNSGALVTGLTTAKLRPYEAVETAVSTIGSISKRNFGLVYGLTPTAIPGLYDLCMTPTGAGMVWRRPGFLNHSYLIKGIVLGTVAADNGLFVVSLQ